MKNLLLVLMAGCLIPGFVGGPQALAWGPSDAGLVSARAARDRSDTKALAAAIEDARHEARRAGNVDSYLRVALLEQWMCEAGYDHQDQKLVKRSAQEGLAAAEKAVELNPNSSQAHALTGDLLGQLIPLTFAGPMRYGPRGTRELDKALTLDPKNAEALVSRAKAYFFTPSMFGGDKQKAVSLLKQVTQMDSSSDAADTAHIWLAQMYLDRKQQKSALQEAEEAKRLNPQRLAAQAVYNQASRRTTATGR